MFLAALVVLYLCGARGLLLVGLALVVTAIASYVLLARMRERMAVGLNSRLSKATSKVSNKAAEFKERLDEGTAAEDVDEPETRPADQTVAEASKS
jgi:hypothetical protein